MMSGRKPTPLPSAPKPELEPLLTIADVQQILQLSKPKVYELMHGRGLSSLKEHGIGGKLWLFFRIDMALFLVFDILFYCFPTETPLIANFKAWQLTFAGKAYYSARMDTKQVANFVCIEYVTNHDVLFLL